MQTLNRNSWSEKEEKILEQILKKNKEYVLSYSFEQAALKLNRSYSAVMQHYYYHKKKYDKKNVTQEFKEALKTNNYKIIKHKNLFIVQL